MYFFRNTRSVYYIIIIYFRGIFFFRSLLYFFSRTAGARFTTPGARFRSPAGPEALYRWTYIVLLWRGSPSFETSRIPTDNFRPHVIYIILYYIKHTLRPYTMGFIVFATPCGSPTCAVSVSATAITVTTISALTLLLPTHIIKKFNIQQYFTPRRSSGVPYFGVFHAFLY